MYCNGDCGSGVGGLNSSIDAFFVESVLRAEEGQTVVISSPILTLIIAPDPVQIHVPTIVDTSVGNTAVLCLTALSPPNNEVTVHLTAMNMNID